MPAFATYKHSLLLLFIFVIQMLAEQMDEETISNHKRDIPTSDAVNEDFKQACLFIRDQKVTTDDKLRLYGLFKCATVGVCNTTSPTIFQALI